MNPQTPMGRWIVKSPRATQAVDVSSSRIKSYGRFEFPYQKLWTFQVSVSKARNTSQVSTPCRYGDMFPQTPMGRYVAIFAALLAVVLVALAVGAVTDRLTLTRDESKVDQFASCKVDQFAPQD